MTLLTEVIATLESASSPHAMIGASRSTQDLDVLPTDRAVLERAFWEQLASSGTTVEIRTGDIQDPLVWVVRATREGDRPGDIVVGEAPWQDTVLSEAVRRTVADIEVPVVNEVGLILLKLYAGGPQDRWDVEQVLAVAPDRRELTGLVEERVDDLPPRCQRLWDRIKEPEI